MKEREAVSPSGRTMTQELELVAPSELQERKSDESLRDWREKPRIDKDLFSGWRWKTVPAQPRGLFGTCTQLGSHERSLAPSSLAQCMQECGVWLPVCMS
jgi:hypothetical protein